MTLIVGILLKPNPKDDENDVEPTELINANCPPKFSYEFVDFTKIDAFQPIGSITGASRGRSYITVQKDQIVAVYTPMDAILVSIIDAYRGPDADHGEYGFKFSTDCGVTFLLDHLDTVSDGAKAVCARRTFKINRNF